MNVNSPRCLDYSRVHTFIGRDFKHFSEPNSLRHHIFHSLVTKLKHPLHWCSFHSNRISDLSSCWLCELNEITLKNEKKLKFRVHSTTFAIELRNIFAVSYCRWMLPRETLQHWRNIGALKHRNIADKPFRQQREWGKVFHTFSTRNFPFPLKHNVGDFHELNLNWITLYD